VSGSGPPHRFFFVHIQKTAGTALKRRLRNHFGAALYPTRGVDGEDMWELLMSVARLRERMAARGDEIEAIAGHFPLRTVDELDGSFSTLTVLREPVDRMLSTVRGMSGGRTDLDEVYDGLHGLANNNMTKMLALTPAELKATIYEGFRVDRDHLKQAKEQLAAMDAVGFQEQLEDFCGELSARFGWDLGEPVVVNTGPELEASGTLRERIAEDNQLDLELYELARELAGRAPV
jgi:hypothetical protein